MQEAQRADKRDKAAEDKKLKKAAEKSAKAGKEEKLRPAKHAGAPRNNICTF